MIYKYQIIQLMIKYFYLFNNKAYLIITKNNEYNVKIENQYKVPKIMGRKHKTRANLGRKNDGNAYYCSLFNFHAKNIKIHEKTKKTQIKQ